MNVMLGSDFDGRLRHLELLKANSEDEALKSSEWYKRLCQGDMHFPKSFQVLAGSDKTIVVPAMFLVDQQIVIGMANETNEHIIRHVVLLDSIPRWP